MMKKPKVSEKDLLELIYWARRYCDGRSTYAPHRFNDIYKRIRSDNAEMLRCGDRMDETLLDNGAYWPYAQDGMYKADAGHFDAMK